MISAIKIKWAAAQNRAAQSLASSALWRRWQNLSSDGQRIIRWSAMLLTAALVWAYVWLPAARGRETLSLRIPVLQAQLAAMRSQADEVKRINTTPLVVTTNARTLADTVGLQIAFGQNNTATTANTTVTINERRQFRVNIASIAYTSWLDNLDAALKRYRVRVVSVNLKPLQPGNSAALIAVELVLADDAPSGR